MIDIVDNIYEVRNVCRAPSDGAVNVRHYRVAVVNGVGVDEITAADAFAAEFKPAYLLVLNENTTWETLTLQKIWPLPVGSTFNASTVEGVGSVLGDMLPRQVSGIITLRTSLAHQAGRGRLYIPFPSEGSNVAIGQPSAGYVAAAADLAVAIMTTLTIGPPAAGVEMAPILWHRLTHTFTALRQAVIRGRWATQRRRNNNRF